MVELVDTLGSGSSERTLMQVRVLFRAPLERAVKINGFFHFKWENIVYDDDHR